MSVQQARDFLDKVGTDSATAYKAHVAHQAALVSVAEQEGFEFSVEDLREAVSEISVLEDLPTSDADEVV